MNRIRTVSQAVILLVFFLARFASADEMDNDYTPPAASQSDLDFRLPSTEIRSYGLSDFKNLQAVMLVAVDAQSCNEKSRSLDESRVLRDVKKLKKTKLLFIDSAMDPDRELIAGKQKGQKSHYLFDPYQQVSRSFGFRNVGDYVILQPAADEVVQRGNLDSLFGSEPLPMAVKELGEIFRRSAKITNGTQKVNSCALTLDEKTAAQFQEGFLRPFARACLSCHMSSQVYDYFTSMDQVLGWRAMSLKTIRQMRMPGRYDPYYNQKLVGANLKGSTSEPSIEDLRRVVRWLESPPNLTDEMRSAFLELRKKRKFAIDNPQPVLPIIQTVTLKEPVAVPASGGAAYLNTFLGEPLKEDIAVQGFNLRTNLQSVHHTTIFAFDPQKVNAEEFKNSANMSFHLRAAKLKKFFGENVLSTIDGFLNGKKLPFNLVNEPVLATFSRRQGRLIFPLDSALRIKKGMQFAVQLHMEPSGKPESVDVSFDVLGRSSSEDFKPLRRWSIEPNARFRIAAGQPSYVARAEVKIDRPIQLKVLSVHTHYRGIAARILLQTPNGRQMTIASIPFMQFKMDRVLTLPGAGVSIGSGSLLVSEIEYDNSVHHLANPDPDVSVELGGSTRDNEMHYPRYLFVDEG